MAAPKSIFQTQFSNRSLLPNERVILSGRIYRFLSENKFWTFGFIIVAVLFAGGILAWFLREERVQYQAGICLAKAYSIDSFQKVIQDFPRTDAAFIAALSSADRYFQEKQWEQAKTCYETALKQRPNSLLAPSAWVGLAATAEALGKLDESIHNYQFVVTQFPKSFQAPQAQFALARLQESGSKFDEARKSYEELIAKYPKSMWKEEAVSRLQKINLINKTKPVFKSASESVFGN